MCRDTMYAPCGIDCAGCEIFIAANDPEAAERLATEWRASWQPKAQSDWFKCQGCRGDRSLCWSGDDCKIYPCCVEEKRLDFCYLCDSFPCHELEKWGAEYANHVKAFEWLKEMREKLKAEG